MSRIFRIVTLISAVCIGQTYAQTQVARSHPAVVKCTVVDEAGEALVGVSVRLKSKGAVVGVTDREGGFTANVENINETLVFTYVGMKPKELKMKSGSSNYKVIMENNATELAAVVINAGIIQRDKMGFTGSYKSIGREELQSVGNINIIQTLRSLDASFVIAENNLSGSDPNSMANISIRGGSTINISAVLDDRSENPNEPLFILDGFETTLQAVNDLDVNRIESVTILKDAGSTAIYGSRGGNGVIVIETVKPKAGQVRIDYRSDLQIAAADLSVYNLMDAREKLQFELKAGRYGNIDDWSNPKNTDYYIRLEEVERGVNTYWLKVPLQTVLTQSHSLNIDGGGESGFLYQIGGNFKNTEGVMKGSSRETFGGNVRLNYRKGKFNISNNLSVSVTNGYDGAWGSFSDFARANPYYRMTGGDGTIPAFLDSFSEGEYWATYTAPNPYYNASLFSQKESKNTGITNNSAIDWFIRDNLRWSASLSINGNTGGSTSFKDPRHTDYQGQDYTLQGQYSSSNSNKWSYNANTSVNYSFSMKKKHNATFTGRAAVKSVSSAGDSYSVTGFPKGVPGNPAYAYSYREGSRPGYSESIAREADFLLAFNYNYRLRYLFDLNYNADGSTAFGRNRKFQNFFSAGIGWNIKLEPFAESLTWLQHLKIRGNYGTNSNRNVDNLSMNVYSYYAGNDIFGAASYLSGFANPNLKWQIVTKTSSGIDAAFLDNRLSATIDVYRHDTDPLVVSPEQKPSSGVSQYPINLGYLITQGFEFAGNYQIIRNAENRTLLSIRLTAGANRSAYGGFDEALNNLNESYKKEEGVEASRNINSLVQYRDGGSPGDLWAVRSLGIDPASGREVFLTKDGAPTFAYSADDRVVVANRNAKVQGIVGFSFRYGNFTANANFRYSLGGYEINSALFNKVENIAGNNIIYNQDKRALYSRWQNPGDVAEFKGISLTATTPVSSRFIQRNNFFSGESAQIAWSFAGERWLKRMKIRDLQLKISYSDLFYASTIKRERGIDYPFQRAATVAVGAQF
jgi:TonB-linked SusC/RagA family outer membrane protein